MTAFASLAAFVAALKAPRAYTPGWATVNSNAGSSGCTSAWLGSGGSAPGGNVVPLSTTAGALCPAIETGADLFLGEIEMTVTRKDLRWALMLVDRLVHTDGLDGTSGSVQTTNLPTTPLTRATSGAEVRAACEIYTQIGSTNGITVSSSYTNQAGASGHTSDPVGIGGTTASFISSSAFIPMSLAAGDTGVRSVESVTLSATTGTVGNFGVTLYRPLCMVYGFGDGTGLGGRGTWCPLLGPSGGSLPKLDSNACLMWIAYHITNDLGANTVLGQSIRLVRQ